MLTQRPHSQQHPQVCSRNVHHHSRHIGSKCLSMCSLSMCSPKLPQSLAVTAVAPQLVQRHRSTHRSRWCSMICRSAANNKLETVSVVEYLLLLQAKPDADLEDVEVLLDSLWSLQYMIPSIMCASAGYITGCRLCKQHLQTPPEQLTINSASPPPSNSSDEECRVQQLVPGMFTHAVHFRLNSRHALETLLLHPLMAAMHDQINTLCATSAQLVFEGTVAKRIEALFRRGDEFASGVEHVMLLQPGGNGGAGADEFLQRLAALAESSVAGGIQASYGAVISCAHTAATHVLMTRFAAQHQIEQLLATPACTAVVRQDPRVPVVAASSLCISIQPAEETTKVNGGGNSMGLN